MHSMLPDLIDSLGSSLHSYLLAAGVWSFPGDESIKLALVDLVEDQRSIADRAGRMIESRGGIVPRPAYPIHFTATHDADLGALLPRILEGVRRQIARLDDLVDAGGDPAEVDLVRQAREAAIQHGDVLEGIARRSAGATLPAPN